MSRIIDKLVKASGGWENFLYRTLKDVCDDLRPSAVDAGVGGIVDEARDVLEAYEETRAVDADVDKKEVRPTPVGKTQATVGVGADESAKPAQPDKFESHKSKSVEVPTKPVSKPFTVRIRVDEEVGGAQGNVPLPQDFKIVNRNLLSITTKDGLHLGQGLEDGQIKGVDVSGHVSVSGKYRLVFKDTTLGVVCIHFEALHSPEVPKIDKDADDKRAAEVQQALALHRMGTVSPAQLAVGLRQVENVDAERLDKIKDEVG